MVSGRALAKQAAWHSGALAAWHRQRNRRALTVVMFHRVLAEGDRRLAYCDPEYTIRADLFAACLEFFTRHYHVIDVDQLDLPGAHLPDHPLLITFDDGWADHEQVALPILANAGLPAVVFVAADAVDAAEPTAFWEIQLVHAARRGALTVADVAALWQAAGAPGPAPASTDLEAIRALVARLFALPPERVPALLAPLAERLATPGDRHLLRRHELRNLPRQRLAVGAHGKRHVPLARVADPAADIAAAADLLGEWLEAPVPTMSFPHGSYDPRAAAAALARHRWVFTSDPVLNPLAHGVPRLLGRIGFDPAAITDRAGQLRPELLALTLMRRPHRLLDGRGPRRPA